MMIHGTLTNYIHKVTMIRTRMAHTHVEQALPNRTWTRILNHRRCKCVYDTNDKIASTAMMYQLTAKGNPSVVILQGVESSEKSQSTVISIGAAHVATSAAAEFVPYQIRFKVPFEPL